ncbi:MAG: dienelactone hydrolase [Cognaticolwellia sp.]|jgi:dienelactone hydrolase
MLIFVGHLIFAIVFSVSCQASSLVDLPDKSSGLERHLFEFEHDELQQFSLFIQSDLKGKTAKNLVVIAHGFHPDPPNYGKIKSGDSKRPGDYYRYWVEQYAKAGFNVFVPDYRGHNKSQGYEFTHQANKVKFPEQYYASDLVASVLALEKYLAFQYENIVLIGHSMGSPIAFYSAAQLGEKVKLVSLWSSAMYRFDNVKVNMPYVIHHGEDDKVTPITNSDFYIKNYGGDLVYKKIYDTDKHLISEPYFTQAIKKDIELIMSIFNH